MAPQHKTRRHFSKQFKAETVALIRSSGKSVPQVCRDSDLADSVLQHWLAKAEIDDHAALTGWHNSLGLLDYRDATFSH